MRRPHLVPALVLVLLLAWWGPHSCHRPSFRLLTLGAYGGSQDGNLTAFALRLADRDRYRVLLDAGSLAPGIDRHLGGKGFQATKDFFLDLEALFLTHAHLDHLTGFVTFSPALFERPEPLRIHSHRATLEAFREHVLRSDLWIDLERFGRVQLQPLDPPAEVVEDGMRFRLLPLEHPAPSCGFLIEAPSGAAFVHLGDTGPTRAYQPMIRPLLREGRLRAISLECSFPDEQLELALLSGHLTPDLVLRQLVDLVTEAEFPPGSEIPPVYLQETARALSGVTLLLQHLKPDQEARIRDQVEALRKLGLPFRILRQGEEVAF